MGKLKCISAEIYKPSYGDCSNNGITSRYTEILIPHDQGWIEVDTEDLPENFCSIEIRELFGNTYINLVPKTIRERWHMMGGCFAYSSDSRFRDFSEYPIPIHDRIES